MVEVGRNVWMSSGWAPTFKQGCRAGYPAELGCHLKEEIIITELQETPGLLTSCCVDPPTGIRAAEATHDSECLQTWDCSYLIRRFLHFFLDRWLVVDAFNDIVFICPSPFQEITSTVGVDAVILSCIWAIRLFKLCLREEPTTFIFSDAAQPAHILCLHLLFEFKHHCTNPQKLALWA